ncbi:hypothetical protein [Paracidovorax wautersii]|uniref:DUF4230 domain-containing protein n=1 Tax=Paracidovorax wautersii TaxID=1177982 RepID=A0ABU1IEN8_9BURK|nr:hypothetical protein [Paracidovorax wautersii]MDR6215688.1 hypothetical protein [Paracidovorax wautersii]
MRVRSRPLIVLAAAALLGAVALAGWAFARLHSANEQVAQLQQEVTSRTEQLLGYTRYTSYLTVGQQSLAEQMKLLTATVVREEGATQIVEKSVLGLASTGVVAIWYTAEYAFGYDLRPGQYELRPTAQGLEVHLARPALVATPAISQLRHRVLSGGLLTDDKGAVIRLQQEAARRAETQGRALAADPAVLALCEKSLTSFLADFLARQPGVRAVPRITVVYR